jgi:hypothetical protein
MLLIVSLAFTTSVSSPSRLDAPVQREREEGRGGGGVRSESESARARAREKFY